MLATLKMLSVNGILLRAVGECLGEQTQSKFVFFSSYRGFEPSLLWTKPERASSQATLASSEACSQHGVPLPFGNASHIAVLG